MTSLRRLLCYIIFLFLLVGCAQTKSIKTITPEESALVKKYAKQVDTKDGRYHVLIKTTLGDMVVKLYNETPLHRDNFVKKVKEGFYDSLLFHRVIDKFMIQGGDPESKSAKPGEQLGNGSAPGDNIPAEFRTEQHIYHKRGVLAAARDNNPEKSSSNCQFYIVQRKPWRLTELDSSITRRNLRLVDQPKITLNEEQKTIYTTLGGTPHLDGSYTVFGELEIGFDVLDKIAATKTDKADRPENDVRMKMFLLNEIKNNEHK